MPISADGALKWDAADAERGIAKFCYLAAPSLAFIFPAGLSLSIRLAFCFFLFGVN